MITSAWSSRRRWPTRRPGARQEWSANPQWSRSWSPETGRRIPSSGKQGVSGDGDRAIISLVREEGTDSWCLDYAKAMKEARKRRPRTRLWIASSADEAAERWALDDLPENLESPGARSSFDVGDKASSDHREHRNSDDSSGSRAGNPTSSPRSGSTFRSRQVPAAAGPGSADFPRGAGRRPSRTRPTSVSPGEFPGGRGKSRMGVAPSSETTPGFPARSLAPGRVPQPGISRQDRGRACARPA